MCDVYKVAWTLTLQRVAETSQHPLIKYGVDGHGILVGNFSLGKDDLGAQSVEIIAEGLQFSLGKVDVGSLLDFGGDLCSEGESVEGSGNNCDSEDWFHNDV